MLLYRRMLKIPWKANVSKVNGNKTKHTKNHKPRVDIPSKLTGDTETSNHLSDQIVWMDVGMVVRRNCKMRC